MEQLTCVLLAMPDGRQVPELRPGLGWAALCSRYALGCAALRALLVLRSGRCSLGGLHTKWSLLLFRLGGECWSQAKPAPGLLLSIAPAASLNCCLLFCQSSYQILVPAARCTGWAAGAGTASPALLVQQN
jgi:hypothetical protein